MKIGSLRNNPKLIAGICVLAALVIAIAVLIITALPTVREVQREELGYYQGDIDGQFGNGTREAVVAFQTKNGLDPDGLAGEETQQKLFSDEAVPYSE